MKASSLTEKLELANCSDPGYIGWDDGYMYNAKGYDEAVDVNMKGLCMDGFLFSTSIGEMR